MKSIYIILLLIAPLAANADCLYNGKKYPEGTEIAGLVCQADGTWE